MISSWQVHQKALQNPDEVLLAIYYHDAIYQSTRKDNELKSAQLATEHLAKTRDLDLTKIQNLILCTAKHQPSTPDESLLVNFDLQILGSTWDVYVSYCGQIRKEYRVYPDFLYKPGRIKALQHFLSQEYIFKTADFRIQFEKQARQNMAREVELLR